MARPHRNRMPFRGVLAPIDVASDRAPSGARGKRVILTRAAAERALPSLIGMAVGCTPSLDGHDARRKVGVITAARIERSAVNAAGESSGISGSGGAGCENIVVEGHLFGHDFPEVSRELRARGQQLGMSYEVTDAAVEDLNAGVWRLTDVTFTGAAVLRRDKAAYRGTSMALCAHAASGSAAPPPRSSDPTVPVCRSPITHHKSQITLPETAFDIETSHVGTFNSDIRQGASTMKQQQFEQLTSARIARRMQGEKCTTFGSVDTRSRSRAENFSYLNPQARPM